LKETGGTPLTITDANFDSLVRSGGPIVVDFWAAWCGPCRIIGPIIESLAAERSDVRFGKLNVDENPRTSSQFVVSTIPTLIFFGEGKEKDRLNGAVPKAHIERWINQQLRT
jgi:thioredoxin